MATAIGMGGRGTWTTDHRFMIFTHLGIESRLALVFGSMIAVFLAIAAVACLRIQSMNGDIDSIVERRQPAARLANELKVAVGDASRAMASVLVMSDDVQIRQELAFIDAQMASQDMLLAALAGKATESDATADLKKLVALRDEFTPAQAAFVKRVAAGDRSAVTATYLLSLRGVQTRYLAALRAFASTQDEAVRRACRASAVEARQAGVLVLGLALAAAFASAWAGLRVVRSIAPAKPRSVAPVQELAGRA